MATQEAIKEIYDIISNEETEAKFFFITRHEKPGSKKTMRVAERYEFKAQMSQARKELAAQFKQITIKQLHAITKKTDYEIVGYSVIADDAADTLYTYALNNAISFSSVLTEQLLVHNFTTIPSLSSVKNNLWAYAIQFQLDEKLVYTFRKLSAGKIIVGNNEANKRIGKKLIALFDIDREELRPADIESVVFDERIDCLFYNNEFLVLSKKSFEQMAGLEEEFRQTANEVLEVIKSAGIVEGVEHISNMAESSMQTLRSLANIGRKKNHQSLNLSEIDRMKEVLLRFEDKELKINQENNKIMIEDNHDVKDFLRLLNDYYKQGMVSGKYYGTSSGQRIEPKQ